SSDVCSSDLGLARHQQYPQPSQRRPQGQDCGGRARPGHRLPARRRHQPDGAAVCRWYWRVGCPWCRVLRLQQHPGVAQDRCQPTGDGSQGCALGRGRGGPSAGQGRLCVSETLTGRRTARSRQHLTAPLHWRRSTPSTVGGVLALRFRFGKTAMALIPATILTGFLGSGKTTLLKRVLTEAHGQKIAVVENEFGEENIDNDILVADTNENIIQMSNGCVCCTIRDDLRATLTDLAQKKRKGEL